ncbi:MAG: ATP-binding cassette domain-containing protein [Eubacteriales bacterium]|nr:ATP-binding cassette domain-containing protein [Eubacteriales bacterium]
MNLEAKNLEYVYPGGKRALKRISLSFQPGMTGLLGPNGAGKTTLMKLLCAGLMPEKGAVLVNGEPLAKKEKELKKNLGYLPQSFGLYEELTVWQFLDYMAVLKQLPDREKAISQALAETHLTEKKKNRIRTLSGGQRQRVGIAQALLGNPGLLIFDEPTVGLDPEERVYFRNLLAGKAKTSILILSTHIIEDVQAVCDRLLVMNHGEILYDGTAEELEGEAECDSLEQAYLWLQKGEEARQ